MKQIIIGKRIDESAADVKLDVGALIYSRAVIQGNSGAGKSGLVRVIIEQTAARIPTIVIDKEGEFHTLREKLDLVLVAEDGEIAPDVRSAALLARRLIELHASAVIDLSSFTNAEDQQQFVSVFLDALINLPKSLWRPTLIVIDESQFFFPEKGFGESVATSAGVNFMTLGRKRGFSGLLVTPRLGMLNKNVANANNYFIGRTGLDVDQTRAGKTLGMKPKDAIALRDLAQRQFYAFGPDLNFNGVALFRVADCQTTIPKPGELKNLTPPKASAVVKDIASKLKDLPAKAEAEIRTITEAKKKIQEQSATIKEMREGLVSRPDDLKRIKELEAGLQAAIERARTAKAKVKFTLKDSTVTRLEKDLEKAEKLLDMAITAMNSDVLKNSLHNMRNALTELTTPLSFEPDNPSRIPSARELGIDAEAETARMLDEHKATPPQRAPIQQLTDAASNGDLKPGPAKVLTALIQFPDGLEKPQIVAMTGYRGTSTYEFLKILMANNLATRSGKKFAATPQGRLTLPNIDPLPTGAALREFWKKTLPTGEWTILNLLINAYPGGLSKQDLIEKSGYKGTSTYEYAKKLKSRKLITGDASKYIASATLF